MIFRLKYTDDVTKALLKKKKKRTNDFGGVLSETSLTIHNQFEAWIVRKSCTISMFLKHATHVLIQFVTRERVRPKKKRTTNIKYKRNTCIFPFNYLRDSPDCLWAFYPRNNSENVMTFPTVCIRLLIRVRKQGENARKVPK